MPLLLVYGTLKRDKSNHRKLGLSEFVGEATTAQPYLLLQDSNIHYPFLIDIPVAPITGELYEVSDTLITQLDCFEGHPHFFERRPVQLTDGREAFTYFYKQLNPITTF